MFGTEFTNGKLREESAFLSTIQRILWTGTPLFLSSSTVDIVRQNFKKPFYFTNLAGPGELEWKALSNEIISIHDLKREPVFNCGRFLYPLKRAALNHLPPIPWHLKMSFATNTLKEANEICDTYLKELKLPVSWRKRIFSSIAKIKDEKRFTAQLQISARCLFFNTPCKDCGQVFNTVVHAFANCPMLHFVKEFVRLNVKGANGKIYTAVLLFGLSNNLQRGPSKTRTLDITLSSIRSYLAKKMTDNELIKNQDIKAIIISTAA
eukprot:TRINITY_DN3287_c0_g1_i1.p1 TRINITY_DN3287_c0_g1~~TRINITY_DN3287_c0_g1_i1.p1  ORF type:complete len:289 (+),score=-21.77 TRINITY_DN3287_c0_g1_i1:73-867(+)